MVNGPRRTSAQAGNDPHVDGGRVGWLASILHRLAGAFSRRNRRAVGPSETVGHHIARRAERVSNRKRSAADRYIAIHTTLSRGRG